ncbi:MAG: CpaE family protein [Candidatus Binataceae bacterium]
MDDTYTVQLVGGSDPQRSQLQAFLEQLAPPRLEVVEDSPEAEGERPQVDVVAAIVDENPAVAVDCLRGWSDRSPRPLLIAFHREWPLALMRQILQAGANELVSMPPNAHELELIFLKLMESRHPRERGRDGMGRVYAVTGLAGGVGMSTVSANLALALKYTMNRRVAILDLDLQNGGINLSLHLDPTETIVALLEELERLDSIRLETALTKHPAGIYLLAAPKRIEQADLVSDVAVATILDMMRQLFDVVVVDCGRHVTDNTLVAWERCTQVLYVTDQSLWSARRVPRFTQLFTSLGLRGVNARLVLNRFAAGSGATRDEIAGAARAPVFACIPRDDRLMEALQLHNEDLWRVAPSSRLARAFEDLARRLESPDATPEAPRFVERLMSAIGVRT